MGNIPLETIQEKWRQGPGNFNLCWKKQKENLCQDEELMKPLYKDKADNGSCTVGVQ